jgi:hypothetical protein
MGDECGSERNSVGEQSWVHSALTEEPGTVCSPHQSDTWEDSVGRTGWVYYKHRVGKDRLQTDFLGTRCSHTQDT